MGFNNVILELRTYHGVSQQQVAEAVGISQSTIAKIEIGRNEATASTIRKLADYFQVSADYLLERSTDFSEVVPPSSPTLPKLSLDEQKLLKNFQAMRPDLQTYFIKMSETLAQPSDAITGSSNKKKA